MKTRDIKELLILLRGNLDARMGRNKGMCLIIHEMRDADIITFGERDIILDYLKTHVPQNAIKRESKYGWWRSDPNGYFLGRFWWAPGKLKPRLDWLNEQIAKL